MSYWVIRQILLVEKDQEKMDVVAITSHKDQ